MRTCIGWVLHVHALLLQIIIVDLQFVLSAVSHWRLQGLGLLVRMSSSNAVVIAVVAAAVAARTTTTKWVIRCCCHPSLPLHPSSSLFLRLPHPAPRPFLPFFQPLLPFSSQPVSFCHLILFFSFACRFPFTFGKSSSSSSSSCYHSS